MCTWHGMPTGVCVLCVHTCVRARAHARACAHSPLRGLELVGRKIPRVKAHVPSRRDDYGALYKAHGMKAAGM